MVFDKLDPEEFPTQIGKLAHDVITFLHCLNEFPEFTDEAVNASIVAFEGDLKVCRFQGVYLTFSKKTDVVWKYWASCLKAYEGLLIRKGCFCAKRYSRRALQDNFGILQFNDIFTIYLQRLGTTSIPSQHHCLCLLRLVRLPHTPWAMK